MIVNHKFVNIIILFSTHIISFFEWIVFFFAASLNLRDGSVILFQWHCCDFFIDFVFTWIVQFFKITFHTSSNHDWKKQWISHFFKYQFCLIKNKFNTFNKNSHQNISTFQQIEFSITERHCNSMMIQCVNTYYWFLQRVFFCFFQSDDLIETKYVFLHFIYMFLHNELSMSMMTWMCDWDFQIFQNESFCKRK